MQVFAVFDVDDHHAMEKKLQERFPEDHLVVSSPQRHGRGSFFVAANGLTTKDLAERLGLLNDDQRGIVVPVTTYWGRHDPTTWEWINVKAQQNGG